MNLNFPWVLVVISGCLSLQCTKSTEQRELTVSDGSQFVGSTTCKSCHEDIYKNHLLTPHHLTSQLADSTSILGSFKEHENAFFYSPDLFVMMDKNHDQFSQTLYSRNEKVKSKSIDFVVGSGVRGQTYLTWQDSSLFQLPIGFFTSVNTWANSPGFSNRPIFNRPITSRCLECHSTFFKKTLSSGKGPEHFSKKKFMLGVDCEKCHGPGLKHVSFHQQNAQEKEGKFIVSFKHFSRKQQLDFCRSCHGGKMAPKKPAFTFQPGHDLNEYFRVDSVQVPSGNLDSHGNQFGMLSQSKCFLKSDMTCLTCHSVHENEKNKVVNFSNRCMTCHTEANNTFCSFKKLTSSQLKQNCIQCHLPEKNSNAIRMLLQGESTPTPAKMHVHYITTAYQEEVVNYLKSIPLSKN